MRFPTLFAFLALLVSPAIAGPFAGSDDYRAHLESLGYSVEDGETTLLAKHETYYNVSVKDYVGGILVVTFFGTTDGAKSDRVGFFEFLNALNADATAARYYEDDEGDVIVEAWYAGGYDRSRFDTFLERFNEIGQQLGESGVAADFLE